MRRQFARAGRLCDTRGRTRIRRETPVTYAQGRVINDADSHVMETREWLDPYMDGDLKAKLRPLYGREPGRIDKLLDQAKARRGDAEAEAKAFENPIAGPKGWIAAGAFDS